MQVGDDTVLQRDFNERDGFPTQSFTVLTRRPPPPSPPPSPPPPLPPPSPAPPPSPPGFEVTVTVTVEAAIGDVDIAALKQRIATFLGVLPRFVEIIVQAGSLVVEIRLWQIDGGDSLRRKINEADQSTLEAIFDAPVAALDISSSMPYSPPPPSPNVTTTEADVVAEGAGLTRGDFIAIGSSCAAGGVALLCVLVFFRIRARLAAHAKKQTETIEKSLAATASFAFPLHIMTARDFMSYPSLAICELPSSRCVCARA